MPNNFSKEENCHHGSNSHNHNEAHTQLVKDILVELSRRAYVRVWKSQTGVFRDLEDDDRIIRTGVKGGADISGILRIRSGYGIRLEIEVKTGSGRQTPDQKNFQRMIESLGGFYVVARSVQDAVEFCDRAANR